MKRAPRKTLETFIREAMLDPEPGKPLHRLALMHAVGSSFEEHYTARVSQKSDAKDLAEVFKGKAETYSQDFATVQSFVVWGFYGEEAQEAQARYMFMVRPEFDPNEMGLSTEAPTPSGIQQQGMRFAEMIVTQAYAKQSVLDRSQATHIDTLSRYLHQAHEEKMAMFEVLMRAAQEKVDRQHERTLQYQQYERSTAERAKWMALIPALANQVLGREIFPQATADTALLELAAEKIDVEQIGMLSQMLPAEVVMPLMNRFAEIAAKKRKEQEMREAARPPTASSDPEANAAGDVETGHMNGGAPPRLM